MQLVQICNVIYLDSWPKLSLNFCATGKSFNDSSVLLPLVDSDLYHTHAEMTSELVIVYSNCFWRTLCDERYQVSFKICLSTHDVKTAIAEGHTITFAFNKKGIEICNQIRKALKKKCSLAFILIYSNRKIQWRKNKYWLNRQKLHKKSKI